MSNIPTLRTIIQNSKDNLTKGSVIIVGKKTCQENIYSIDGVVLYDSFCLASNSSNVYLLQQKNSSKPKLLNIVYICGHGAQVKGEHIINKISMNKIAECLNINFDLSHVTKIYIMACYGKCKNSNRKDMAEELKEKLDDIIRNKINRLEKNYNLKKRKSKERKIIENDLDYFKNIYGKIEVRAFSENITVVANNGGNISAKDIHFALSNDFFREQENLQEQLCCTEIKLDINNYQCELNKYQTVGDKKKIMERIEQHNRKYMSGG